MQSVRPAYVPSSEEEARFAQSDRESRESESCLSRNADEDEYSTQRRDNAANDEVPSYLSRVCHHILMT